VANKIIDQLKSNWKPILWGLIPVIILVIVFALPIKTVPVLRTEMYSDTEMKSVPYTVSETYTDTEAYKVVETQKKVITDANINASGWDYSFLIDKPGSTVTVRLEGAFGVPYTYSYYPRYIIGDGGNRVLRFWPSDYGGYYPGNTKAVIEVSYPEEVTKYRTVTKQRDVIKYNEVATPVLKERKVTRYVQTSLWAYLFSPPQ
jgi:hypothetical protein